MFGRLTYNSLTVSNQDFIRRFIICFIKLLQTGLSLVCFRVNLYGSRHGLCVIRECSKELFLFISEKPAIFMMYNFPYE